MKRRVNQFLIIGILLLLALLTVVPATLGNQFLTQDQQPDPTIQATTTLHIRSAPSINANQIGTLGTGATRTVIGKNANGLWLQISHEGQRGWVCAEYTIDNGLLAQVPVTDQSNENCEGNIIAPIASGTNTLVESSEASAAGCEKIVRLEEPEYWDNAQEVIEVQVSDRRIEPNGNISANIKLISKTALTYGILFSVETGAIHGSLEALINVQNPSIPLSGNIVQNLGRVEFEPDTRLNIRLNKFGFSREDAAAMLGFDMLTLAMRMDGFDYDLLTERTIDQWTEITVHFIDWINDAALKNSLLDAGVLIYDLAQIEDPVTLLEGTLKLIVEHPDDLIDLAQEVFHYRFSEGFFTSGFVGRATNALSSTGEVARDLTGKPREVQVALVAYTVRSESNAGDADCSSEAATDQTTSLNGQEPLPLTESYSTGRVSIRYPSGWNVGSSERDNIIGIRIEKRANQSFSDGNVIIVLELFPLSVIHEIVGEQDNSPLELLTSEIMHQLSWNTVLPGRQQVPSNAVLSPPVATIVNGFNAIRLHVHTEGTGATEAFMLVFQYNDEIYGVMAVHSSVDQLAQYESTLMVIAESVEYHAELPRLSTADAMILRTEDLKAFLPCPDGEPISYSIETEIYEANEAFNMLSALGIQQSSIGLMDVVYAETNLSFETMVSENGATYTPGGRQIGQFIFNFITTAYAEDWMHQWRTGNPFPTFKNMNLITLPSHILDISVGDEVLIYELPISNNVEVTQYMIVFRIANTVAWLFTNQPIIGNVFSMPVMSLDQTRPTVEARETQAATFRQSVDAVAAQCDLVPNIELVEGIARIIANRLDATRF